MLSVLSSTFSIWSNPVTTAPTDSAPVTDSEPEERKEEEQYDVFKYAKPAPPYRPGYPHWINGSKPDSSVEPVPDMTISRLYIHPIKSCRGTSVSEVRYTPEGLEHDRIFMLIDATTNKCLTAREAPLMVVIYPQVYPDENDSNGGYMNVSFPPESECPSFDVPLVPSREVLKTWTLLPHLQVWSSDVDGYICESLSSTQSPSQILSTFLSRPVHLILKGPRPRPMGRTSTHPSGVPGSVMFQDGFPLLVASEESLEDVNQKVRDCAMGRIEWRIGMMDADKWREESIVMERFRPNFVVSGASQPFAEDLWQDIEVYDPEADSTAPTKRLSMLSRCMRCQLPNVDTQTGIPDPAIPFKVIMKFRNVQKGLPYKPAFGVNAISRDSGVYRVGEKVRVLTCLDREVVPAMKVA